MCLFRWRCSGGVEVTARLIGAARVSEGGGIRIEPAVPRPSPERSSSLQRSLWTSTRTCCVSSPSVEANKCSTDLVWLNGAAVGQTGGALRDARRGRAGGCGSPALCGVRRDRAVFPTPFDTATALVGQYTTPPFVDGNRCAGLLVEVALLSRVRLCRLEGRDGRDAGGAGGA